MHNLSNELLFRDDIAEEHSCRTYKCEDGHRYLEVAPKEHGQQQNVLYQRSCKTLAERRNLINLIHQRTHATPASMRILMQRNTLWHPSFKQYAEELYHNCAICVRSVEPLPSRKVSITHIDCQFNANVGVDFFYWQRSASRTVICLHVMCMGTKLSESQPVESRDMQAAARIVESM